MEESINHDKNIKPRTRINRWERREGTPNPLGVTSIERDHAWQSVNFINSHDGFSLYDLVSYNRKHKVANGHNNRNGMDENFSWNCGWEGDEQLPGQVMELRKLQARNSYESNTLI